MARLVEGPLFERKGDGDGRDEVGRWDIVGGGGCCWDRGRRGAFGLVAVGTTRETMPWGYVICFAVKVALILRVGEWSSRIDSQFLLRQASSHR